MSDIDVQQLLNQMRAMSAMAKSGPDRMLGTEQTGDFSAHIKQAIDQVNDVQMKAGKLAESFELGQPGVNLAEVMVGLQKANVSFQALLQVRNRLLDAYRDVMNMPI